MAPDWQWLALPLALGVGVAGFVKGMFDLKPLKAKVAKCEEETTRYEADRRAWHRTEGSFINKVSLLETQVSQLQGSVNTLTSLLKREIHID